MLHEDLREKDFVFKFTFESALGINLLYHLASFSCSILVIASLFRLILAYFCISVFCSFKFTRKFAFQ